MLCGLCVYALCPFLLKGEPAWPVSHLPWDSLDTTQTSKVHLLPHHNRIVENSKRENNGDNNESTRLIKRMSSRGRGLAGGRKALEMHQAWEFRVWKEGSLER